MGLYATISTNMRKKFGKTSESMGRFCFVIFITGLSRHNTGMNDVDDNDGSNVGSGDDDDNSHIHKSVKIQTFFLSIVKTFIMMELFDDIQK
jgi:hypothetical protein